MEVHHHAHTPRKKWTHYLWEFLMLFLAVFCGFMAENQREHFVERQRAKQYAKSLLADLRLDTTELSQGLINTQFTISSMDSLLAMTVPTAKTDIMPGTFYYYNTVISGSYRIDWNKSTINQMVQSGTLRYFQNELGNKISEYYAFQTALSGNNQVDIIYRDKIMEISSHILENHYFRFFAATNADSTQPLSGKRDSLMAIQLPIQQGSSKLIDELLNQITFRRWRLTPLVSYYKKATNDAKEIIALLKQLYHLK